MKNNGRIIQDESLPATIKGKSISILRYKGNIYYANILMVWSTYILYIYKENYYKIGSKYMNLYLYKFSEYGVNYH